MLSYNISVSGKGRFSPKNHPWTKKGHKESGEDKKGHRKIANQIYIYKSLQMATLMQFTQTATVSQMRI